MFITGFLLRGFVDFGHLAIHRRERLALADLLLNAAIPHLAAIEGGTGRLKVRQGQGEQQGEPMLHKGTISDSEHWVSLAPRFMEWRVV